MFYFMEEVSIGIELCSNESSNFKDAHYAGISPFLSICPGVQEKVNCYSMTILSN